MKKTIVAIILVMMILLITGITVLATNEAETLEDENANEILTIKDGMNAKIEKYSDEYGSDAYGLAAYILNDVVRYYSIPVCFVGIVIGALNQYVLGTRRLDKKHKGYGIIMTFVTLLVVCQILPLVFTVVVIGWRG